VSDGIDKKYKEIVAQGMHRKFKYANVMEVPCLKKIVINRGVGEATVNAKAIEDSVEEMKLITGQAPLITKSKKSIASFKLRAGLPIGVKVTLRGKRMYEFLCRSTYF
jgi:large subunit ribosomal protein L5